MKWVRHVALDLSTVSGTCFVCLPVLFFPFLPRRGFGVRRFPPSFIVAAPRREERCFMHAPICILKAKALGTIVKMQRVFVDVYLFMTLREKRRILEQIHVIIGGSSPHRSHFPPEDMRSNDSLRCCRWNRDTDSMFTTHAISKQRGEEASFPYGTCAA